MTGHELRQIRENLKLSQQALADQINTAEGTAFDRHYVHKVERAATVPLRFRNWANRVRPPAGAAP